MPRKRRRLIRGDGRKVQSMILTMKSYGIDTVLFSNNGDNASDSAEYKDNKDMYPENETGIVTYDGQCNKMKNKITTGKTVLFVRLKRSTPYYFKGLVKQIISRNMVMLNVDKGQWCIRYVLLMDRSFCYKHAYTKEIIKYMDFFPRPEKPYNQVYEVEVDIPIDEREQFVERKDADTGQVRYVSRYYHAGFGFKRTVIESCTAGKTSNLLKGIVVI